MPKNIFVRNGVYWGRFQVAGCEYRKSLHVRVEPAKRAEAKAIRALERVRQEIEDQIHHAIAPPKLWQEVVVVWYEHAFSAISESARKRYLVSLNQCRAWLDGKAIHQVDVACLRELIKARRSAGASNATIRRDLTAISAVLSIAQDENWITENPALTINRKRIPERRDPILLPTEESIAAMLGALPPKIADICAFALETGMRQDEIVQLEWTCIDLNRAVATIHKTKGSKLRAVPLSEGAIEILKRQPKSGLSRIVFHRSDGQTMDWVSSQFGATARRLEQRSAQKSAQWPAQKSAQSGHPFVRFRFHDLRHLFAVNYLKNGGSIYMLQGILGHTSVKTTEIYLAYLTPEQQHKSKLG
ncbi:MAG: site-specific integrase [Sphingomonadales bacterium]|nr:site-specific integrase [Sphingomonadales bacterium]MDE2570347.1 site-specific integrase [Sphingomonadales bacterium]